MAIVVEPYDAEGLDAELLLLALPTGHPLAGRPRLRLADIEAGHQQVVPGAHVYVPHGEQRPPSGDVVQMLRQIELGRMLALLPVSLAERHARPQVAWRPVDDAPQATFAVAWPQHSHPLAVAASVRVATRVAADPGRRPVAPHRVAG